MPIVLGDRRRSSSPTTSPPTRCVGLPRRARARLLGRCARLELAQPLALRRARRGAGAGLAAARRQLDLRLPRAGAQRSLRSDLQHRLRRGAAARPLPGQGHARSRRRRSSARGGRAARGRCSSPSACRSACGALAALPQAALRAALRARRARLLRHPGAAPGARRPGRPATGPASSSSSASPSSLACAGLRELAPRKARPWRGPRPAHRRARRRPGRRRDLGLALGPAARRGRCGPAPKAGRSPRRRWRWPNGPSATGPEDGASPPPPPTPACCSTPANEVALAGSSPDIEDILEETALLGWELPLLREDRPPLRGHRPARNQLRRASAATTSRPTAPADEELLPQSDGDQVRPSSPARRGSTPTAPITVYDLEARPMRGHARPARSPPRLAALRAAGAAASRSTALRLLFAAAARPLPARLRDHRRRPSPAATLELAAARCCSASASAWRPWSLGASLLNYMPGGIRAALLGAAAAARRRSPAAGPRRCGAERPAQRPRWPRPTLAPPRRRPAARRRGGWPRRRWCSPSTTAAGRRTRVGYTAALGPARGRLEGSEAPRSACGSQEQHDGRTTTCGSRLGERTRRSCAASRLRPGEDADCVGCGAPPGSGAPVPVDRATLAAHDRPDQRLPPGLGLDPAPGERRVSPARPPSSRSTS